jgi:hypothetical protein
VRGFLVVESEMKLKLLVREKGVRVLSEEETKPTMAMELLAAKLRRGAEKIEGTRRVAMVFLLETRKSFLALGESGTVKTKTLLSIPSLAKKKQNPQLSTAKRQAVFCRVKLVFICYTTSVVYFSLQSWAVTVNSEEKKNLVTYSKYIVISNYFEKYCILKTRFYFGFKLL